MKKAVKKTSKASRSSKPSKKVQKVNNLGLGVYMGLSLAVYVCVYFFLTNALQIVIPSLMGESVWDKAQLTITAILMTTFMSFGVLMFLTRSTLHRMIKVSGIMMMIAGFVYLYSLVASVLGQI